MHHIIIYLNKENKMHWGSLLLTILPLLVTFLVGLAIKSPIYQSGKKLLSTLSKALEDDKISAEELQSIIDIFKSKE